MTIGYIALSFLHFFQFVLGITVCGLYGTDLQRARNAGKYSDGKWVRLLRLCFATEVLSLPIEFLVTID